jgi:hypothetical protein
VNVKAELEGLRFFEGRTWGLGCERHAVWYC